MDRQLIIFGRQGSESSKKLQVAVLEAARPEDFDWCISLESFLRKFRTANHYSSVLLLIENHSDLDEFLNVSEFFDGLRVFLVLPDREDETLTMVANRLFPRFVTYIDTDFKELSAIIRKIFAHVGSTGRQHRPGGDSHDN